MKIISGLDGSGITSLGGDLDIYTNAALTSLDGLGVISVGENLRIIDNDALTNLDGLGITSVGGNLDIYNNDALTNLDGLNQITAVGKFIRIDGNIALTNVDGLSQITAVGESISIYDNPQLDQCCALCALLAADAADPTLIGENTNIHSNLTGCNSASEILGCDCALLPIELTTFQANIENNTTLPTWQTATETNNKGFEIQRSKDAITWEKIAWQAGQGNSQTTYDYRYIDSNPLFGTSYYGLKQIDFDDTFSYSDIAKVYYTRPGINIYPNPAKNILHFQYSSAGNELVDFTIENHLGQQLIQSQAYTNQPVQVDISGYPAGLYSLNVQDNQSMSRLFSVSR